jgi:predicted metal-dependent hydrolase
MFSAADQQAFEEGAALFNRGQWWEAHEAWEGPWLTATGQERAFLQALILLAAALHRRWRHGSLTHRNFHKAVKYLDTLPDEYGGVELARLRAEVWKALHTPDVVPQLPRVP